MKEEKIAANSVELIALIYKSPKYLDHITAQLKSDDCKATGWNVTTRVVANDANEEVLNRLKQTDINYTIYNDKLPVDYYLNRVYRAWTFGAITSKADNIIFINSDMAFSKGWLGNLLKHHNGVNIPCSRLVESGKMPSGKYGISENFGRSPSSFASNESNWRNYAQAIATDDVKDGGLYMPCVFEKKRFIESGGYPEGNIYRGGIGKTSTPFVKSGDDYYFHDVLEKRYGMKHATVFDSLVYHWQEGEMDE